MRGAFVSVFFVAGLSAAFALPYPQQPVALPPHLLRQYIAQNQQQDGRGKQEATPIYEQDSRTNAQPQYVERAQAQQPPQYTQQFLTQPQNIALSQPGYSPRSQTPRPPVRAPLQPQSAQSAQSALREYEDPLDEPASNYQFGFDVNDDQFTNYQNRKEESQDGVIKGSYSVVDSDGFIRTVTYTADPKEGFKAEVVRKPTDIVVKVPTPAPAKAPLQRPQQPQQYSEEAQAPSRGQQQQYYNSRYQ